jgi:hypothetical protein
MLHLFDEVFHASRAEVMENIPITSTLPHESTAASDPSVPMRLKMLAVCFGCDVHGTYKGCFGRSYIVVTLISSPALSLMGSLQVDMLVMLPLVYCGYDVQTALSLTFIIMTSPPS